MLFLSRNRLPIFVVFFLSCFTLRYTDAYDVLDPNGNITVKWDVMTWNPDGYIAVVSIFNFQKYRHIQPPGWKLGWRWAKNEIIWGMMGAQAAEQGDCSKFKGSIPHCCERNPTIVDLLPGTPYNQQIANCCKGGVITSLVQDPMNALSSFQLTVGRSGSSAKTVRLPNNFTLLTPGPGYTCGPANIINPSKFLTPDKRRVTQALTTWNVVCTYSQFRAQRTPTCCVSLSSFYNDKIVDCPKCCCGCKSATRSGSCVDPHIASVVSSKNQSSLTPVIKRTNHMCPVRVHWHVKLNYKLYWRTKITVTNFNCATNYSQWNVVVQHPNFNNLTRLFSFNYEPLTPYDSTNDTAMLWGIKFYNDLLMQSGRAGNVQSEILFRKDETFTLGEGWAFPRRVYFNGDTCVMPPPDSYPYLPNHSSCRAITLFKLMTTILVILLVI